MEFDREVEAVKRTEINQKNTDWCEVDDCITNTIQMASTLLQKEAAAKDIKYINLSTIFNVSEGLFLDSVHSTDCRYTRI